MIRVYIFLSQRIIFHKTKTCINGIRKKEVHIPFRPIPRVEKAPHRGLFSNALTVPIA
jgi:hypothetical protein